MKNSFFSQSWPVSTLIGFLFVFELLLLTYWRNKFGVLFSPVIFLLISIALSWACFRAQLDKPFPEFKPFEHRFSKLSLAAVVAFAGGVVFIEELFPIMRNFEVNPVYSDIIPALKVYVQRFNAGEYVYVPFSYFGWEIFPNYLPMQWLPFVGSHYLLWDYRQMAGVVMLLGLAGYWFLVARYSQSPSELVMKALLPLAGVVSLLRTDPATFGFTIEPLIYGYYFVLATGIFVKSPWLRAIGIVLCLLSRFSLLFWLPLYFLVLFFDESRKRALYTAALVIIGVLLIYVIPFMSQDWAIFFKSQQMYSSAAVGEWEHFNYKKQPMHLYKGIGFAVFFHQFLDWPLAERVTLLRHLMIAISLATVIFSGWIYVKYRSRIDYRVFLIISLKLYLTVFYAFMQVPYIYLTALPILLSSFMVGMIFTRNEPQKTVSVEA